MAQPDPDEVATATNATQPDVSSHPVRAATVGIAGGGQLARMMFPAADRLALKLVVLDPDPNCSSASLAHETIVGPFDSASCLRRLAEHSDVITFEIERINADVLAELESEGHIVRPSSLVLKTIQDKLLQKQFLQHNGIPTSPFAALDSLRALSGKLPCVWKARRDGYDGRGVAMLHSASDVAELPEVPAMIEDQVDIDYELALLIARDAGGAVAVYPLTDIIMDPHAHVMESVIVPAEVPPSVNKQCLELAAAVVEALDYVGVLAIEYFVDRRGRVTVNELSPRPHNSGHYTIEACATSQFEQHLRAVTDSGLASTELKSPAVTFNVLGAAGASGKPRYIGFNGWSASDGVYVHSYDKPEVRPGRKMGHVTVVASSRTAAIEKAQRIKHEIRVVAADE